VQDYKKIHRLSPPLSHPRGMMSQEAAVDADSRANLLPLLLQWTTTTRTLTMRRRIHGRKRIQELELYNNKKCKRPGEMGDIVSIASGI